MISNAQFCIQGRENGDACAGDSGDCFNVESVFSELGAVRKLANAVFWFFVYNLNGFPTTFLFFFTFLAPIYQFLQSVS